MLLYAQILWKQQNVYHVRPEALLSPGLLYARGFNHIL